MPNIVRDPYGNPLRRNDEITCLRASVERLREALEWIDLQRYTDRSTINPDNAFEKAAALNRQLLAIMDRARAALAEKESGNG